MSAEQLSTWDGAVRSARLPTSSEPCLHLRQVGERLKQRVGDVVDAMAALTEESGQTLDADVEARFARVGAVSTIAVARWMAGDNVDAVREVGLESWEIFGLLAAQRAAPLNEVTKRCLRWWNAAEQVLCEVADQLDTPELVRSRALTMLQRSFSVTLVRMCESFEIERRRVDEELERRRQELAFIATHDGLTGLPNRTLIGDRLEQMIVRSRHSQSPVAALFIDLDNFKVINDTLGHAAGDELLQAVASRLDGVVRDVDALGRLGGDEFVVVAGELSLLAGPEPIAERLLRALHEPFHLPSVAAPLNISASIGVATGDRPSASELLRDADIAMYRAKWKGKGRFVMFEDGMRDVSRGRKERGWTSPRRSPTTSSSSYVGQ